MTLVKLSKFVCIKGAKSNIENRALYQTTRKKTAPLANLKVNNNFTGWMVLF